MAGVSTGDATLTLRDLLYAAVPARVRRRRVRPTSPATWTGLAARSPAPVGTPYRHSIHGPEPKGVLAVLVDGWEPWVRMPCRRTRWSARGGVRQARRWARRGRYWSHHLGRAMTRSWPTPGYCRAIYDGDAHRHWFNGNKFSVWGWMRGGDVALDLDAVARMHRAYRHKRRGKWKSR